MPKTNRLRCKLSRMMALAALRTLTLALTGVLTLTAQPADELRMSVRGEPTGTNPLDVRDEFADLVRYLTGGVLIRVNRLTQQPEPALAVSWKISADGRTIKLELRKNVKFSDESPFDSADVLHTFRLLMAPDLHSSTADSFLVHGKPPVVRADGPMSVSISFPGPVPGMARLFDQVAIQSSRAKPGPPVSLGPYVLREHKQGAYLTFQANANYWKRGPGNAPQPRIRSLRMTVQANRELEALAFRRGEIDLISSVDSRTFDDLAAAAPGQVRDIGPSLDQEFVWFNQSGKAKIPDFRKQWFRNRDFRNAVSLAINRADISRVAFRGRAIPAAGPYPPTNRAFFNSALKPLPYDRQKAKELLVRAGFKESGGVLRDAAGNPVSFSLVTNGGNRARNQMAALIQQDLKAIGITVNILNLDFRALLERVFKTFDYDACLFGMVGVNIDPAAEMDVWLSSGANHMWNPGQVRPETEWEAEIDRLMQQQSMSVADKDRKAVFDRMQQIIYREQPVLYLVHPNGLAAVSPAVRGIEPAVLRPQLLWNIESLELQRTR